jgi:hypothetical protein
LAATRAGWAVPASADCTTTTRDGSVEKQPRSDEDWQALRRHAVVLLEATNLLVIPGRRVLAAIDSRDVDTLLKEGVVMDNACEACHRSFWYPHEVVPPLPAEPPQL